MLLVLSLTSKLLFQNNYFKYHITLSMIIIVNDYIKMSIQIDHKFNYLLSIQNFQKYIKKIKMEINLFFKMKRKTLWSIKTEFSFLFFIFCLASNFIFFAKSSSKRNN